MKAELKKKVGRWKSCYCWSCDKDFHPLGIMSHRTIHKKKKEDVKISYTNGDTYIHAYSKSWDKPSGITNF